MAGWGAGGWLAGWVAGWPSSLTGRLASWLAGWLAEKLDHGSERSNFSKWTIQFPFQFSDPTFWVIRPQRNDQHKLDQEIGSRIGSWF